MQLLSKSSLPFRIYLAGSCLGTILEIFKWDIVGSIIFWKYFDVSYFLQSTYSVTEVKTLSSGDGLEIQWKDGHKSMWVIIHNLQPVSLTRYEMKNTVWLFSTSLFFFRFHNSWLRFSCQCGNCKQGHSGQRIFKISSLPDPIRISYFSVSGKLYEQPEVMWSIYKGNIY